VLQDIPSSSHVKNHLPEGESPKMDKPPSPYAGKSTSEISKASGPKDTDVPTGAKGSSVFSSTINSGRDAHQPPRLDPTEHVRASAQNPKSFGLGVLDGPQHGEDSSVPWFEKQQR
jgi:hypothetical protein